MAVLTIGPLLFRRAEAGMGNSTISLQKILDRVATKGIPTPLAMASGFGQDLALSMANDVMSDIIAQRFNWKWNRKTAPSFYTNSWQQDYPLAGITNIGWLEDCDRVDINNTSLPKPLKQITVRRQLSRASASWAPTSDICWMYNSQLVFGTWPGPGVTFSPLVATQIKQNPLMSMVDANGNLLVVSGFGTTGSNAPILAANSAEGTTVADGTVTWIVVAPTSQGFRVHPLPGAAGPVWQITPYYQMKSPTFLILDQLIDPIPDDFSSHFQKGMDAYCLMASPNPGDDKRGLEAKQDWLRSLVNLCEQADREADAYAMIPQTSPVENIYAGMRNPQDPSQPY